MWITDADGDAQPGHLRQLRRRGRPLRRPGHGHRGRGRAGALLPRADAASDIDTRHGRFGLRATAGDDPDALSIALQGAMAELEMAVSAAAAVRGPAPGGRRTPRSPQSAAGHGRLRQDPPRDVPAARASGPSSPRSLQGSGRRCSAWATASPATAGTSAFPVRSPTPGPGSCAARPRPRSSPAAAIALADRVSAAPPPVRVDAAQGPAGTPEPVPHRRAGAGAAPPPRRPARHPAGAPRSRPPIPPGRRAADRPSTTPSSSGPEPWGPPRRGGSPGGAVSTAARAVRAGPHPGQQPRRQPHLPLRLPRPGPLRPGRRSPAACGPSWRTTPARP